MHFGNTAEKQLATNCIIIYSKVTISFLIAPLVAVNQGFNSITSPPPSEAGLLSNLSFIIITFIPLLLLWLAALQFHSDSLIPHNPRAFNMKSNSPWMKISFRKTNIDCILG